MSTYRIYGLFVRGIDGSKHYFYVGWTSRSIAARVAEHRNRSKRQAQDVYAHMRRLEKQGTEWDSEELYQCQEGEYQLDAEYLYVIRLLRAGHDLRNMRYGDRRKWAFLQRAASNPTIRSVVDVKRARQSQAKGTISDQVRAHGRLRRKEFESMLKHRGIPSIGDCLLFPSALARRLARQGVASIGRGLDLPELVRLARNTAGWRRVREMARDAEARHPLPRLSEAA